MKKNLGTIDRLFRLLGAVAIIILYVTGQITGTTAIVLGIVSLLLIGTSIAGFCPVYPLLRISTIKRTQKAPQT